MHTTLVSDFSFLNLVPALEVDNIDENCCILHSSKTIIIRSGWCIVGTENGKYYRTVLQNQHIDTENELIITRTNGYNLNISDSPLCILESVIFEPKFAVAAKLAALNSYYQIEPSILDECLNNYFKKGRYLRVGDLISVEIREYHPVVVLETCKCPVTLHFKVTCIEGPPYNITNDVFVGYIVNTEHTTVHQETSIQCYIPRVLTEYYPEIRRDGKCWEYSVIPDGFCEISSRIEQLILPFLSSDEKRISLLPIFLLSGKSGSGKSTLLRGLAAKYGLRYFTEDCVLIQNSNPAQTERFISEIFTKISTVTPCVFHFRAAEALCEDESGNKDDRTVDFFIKHLKSISSPYHAIIFCSTNDSSKLTPALHRIFLQKLENPPLKYESRLSLIRWILKRMRIRYNQLIVDEIAHATSNFVYSDLVQLVSRANMIHNETNGIDYGCQNYTLCTLSDEDFLSALGEMNDAYADSIGALEVPNVTWDDIGGLTELKKEILSSLSPLLSSNTLRRSGILLHGPPGTGKTLLAKAIATECKYNFLSVKGPELLNMYVGQSEKNVREVFTRARESAPCIIFFDELDSLAPKRGQGGGSGSVMDRVVSQLLAEMDGIQKKSEIFILAATNRPDLIDSALLRPGRLDKLLYVGSCCDRNSLFSILKALTRKFNLSEDVDFEKLVEVLPQFLKVTGADLYGICSEAWLGAARRAIRLPHEEGVTGTRTVVVSNEDFLSAFLNFKTLRSTSNTKNDIFNRLA